MKKRLLFVLFCCVLNYAKAQSDLYDPTSCKLKGHVKQEITFKYYGKKVGTNIDSLIHPETDTINFDEKGNKINELLYDNNGKLESQVIFDHPDTKTEIMKVYDERGDYLSKFMLKYDDKGNNIELLDVSDMSTLYRRPTRPEERMKFVYKYSDENYIIETDVYTGNSLNEKDTYSYNKSGKMIGINKTYFDHGSQTLKKVVFQYDTTGNKINCMQYKSNGDLRSNSIVIYGSIDNKNNWWLKTEQITVYTQEQINNMGEDITRRVIVYY